MKTIKVDAKDTAFALVESTEQGGKVTIRTITQDNPEEPVEDMMFRAMITDKPARDAILAAAGRFLIMRLCDCSHCRQVQAIIEEPDGYTLDELLDGIKRCEN